MRKSIIMLAAMAVVSVAALLIESPAQAAATPGAIKADASRLYDSSGKTFQPRGANFVRLTRDADGVAYQSTFEPGQFNESAARGFLDQMRHDGYNTARVFIDPGTASARSPHGIGQMITATMTIYGPYMDNFATFVRLAAERNIYVLPSLDAFPQNKYYWGIVDEELRKTCKERGMVTECSFKALNMGGANLNYMNKGHVRAKSEYIKNFVTELKKRVDARALAAILAYQTNNEAYFDASQVPFAQTTGSVKPHNGVTYNMASAADRQQAADASLVEYLISIKKQLQTVQPDAMLTIGFFTNRAVGRTVYNGLPKLNQAENRVPGRPAAVAAWSPVDFVDIHLYPDTVPYDPLPSLNSVEEAWIRKPYIIGELGALKSRYNNDVRRAAVAMKDAQISTCQHGAQGWLFWTWDTYEPLANQELFFKMNETRGAINGQLAPIVRPNPCR